jgi:Domain of unknown function (DUF4062)
MASTPFKAFVSSTYEDLKAHRAHVIQDLRKAGIFVDPMEEWTAESDEPKKFSKERLAGCNFCVLLVALRRGYVPEGEHRSITQLEYQAALDEGMEILVYLLNENSPWPHRFVELEKDPGVREWRADLEKKHGREFFGLEPSSIEIAPAVARWMDKHSRKSSAVGDDWVHLVSNYLDLPINEPDTSVTAFNLLPYALKAVQQAYSKGLSSKSPAETGHTSEVETSQPITTLVASARRNFEESKYERTCFVIMPFGKKRLTAGNMVFKMIDFDRIYYKIFKPAIEKVNVPGVKDLTLIARRIDEDSQPIGDIFSNINSYLEYSRLVIADITGLNANVLYELGVRHRARTSGTIIFRQANSMIPFDISHIKAFPYSFRTPKQAKESRELIRRVVEETLARDYRDSPVRLSGSNAGD